jgi:hypothetical protein
MLAFGGGGGGAKQNLGERINKNKWDFHYCRVASFQKMSDLEKIHYFSTLYVENQKTGIPKKTKRMLAQLQF